MHILSLVLWAGPLLLKKNIVSHQSHPRTSCNYSATCWLQQTMRILSGAGFLLHLTSVHKINIFNIFYGTTTRATLCPDYPALHRWLSIYISYTEPPTEQSSPDETRHQVLVYCTMTRWTSPDGSASEGPPSSSETEPFQKVWWLSFEVPNPPGQKVGSERKAGNVIKAWTSAVGDPPNKSQIQHRNSAAVPQETFSILLT